MNLYMTLNQTPFQINMGIFRTKKKPTRQAQIREEIKEKISKIYDEYQSELPPVFIWLDIEGVAKEVYQDGFQGKNLFKGLCPE